LRSLTVTLGDAGANPLVDIRLYGLRHTFATLMFENSEQLKLVSEMLGHASIKETPPRGPPAGGAVAKLP
jgi:site-specific recombinase XerD